MQQDQIDLIQQWLDKVAILEATKQQELQLRLQLVKEIFNHDIEKCDAVIRYTQNMPNPDYKLTADCGLNYKLDKDDEAVQIAIDRLSKLQDGDWIVENLFKRKLEIVPKIYNLLPPVYKSIVDEIVTLQPSTPQVKFVAPKKEKENDKTLL